MPSTDANFFPLLNPQMLSGLHQRLGYIFNIGSFIFTTGTYICFMQLYNMYPGEALFFLHISFHWKIFSSLEQRCHWAQKQENSWWFWSKTWGFGPQGTLPITDFRKEWHFQWKFMIFSAMFRRLVILLDINNYTHTKGKA